MPQCSPPPPDPWCRGCGDACESRALWVNAEDWGQPEMMAASQLRRPAGTAAPSSAIHLMDFSHFFVVLLWAPPPEQQERTQCEQCTEARPLVRVHESGDDAFGAPTIYASSSSLLKYSSLSSPSSSQTHSPNSYQSPPSRLQKSRSTASGTAPGPLAATTK